MRTISKSLKYNDDLALVPTGMEGRRLPKKFLKQVNKLQRSSSLTRKVFGTRLCGGVRDVSRHGVEPSVWSRCGSAAARLLASRLGRSNSPVKHRRGSSLHPPSQHSWRLPIRLQLSPVSQNRWRSRRPRLRSVTPVSLGDCASFAKCCDAASEPSCAARSYHSRALAGSC